MRHVLNDEWISVLYSRIDLKLYSPDAEPNYPVRGIDRLSDLKGSKCAIDCNFFPVYN